MPTDSFHRHDATRGRLHPVRPGCRSRACRRDRPARWRPAPLALGLTLSAFLLSSVPPVEAQRLEPGLFDDIGIEQKLDDQLPLDLVFTDDQGQQVQIREYFGARPVILALVYYECPMLCTQVLNGLLRGLHAVPFDAGRQFEVVVVSFDPGETAELAAAKKRQYVGQYGREGAEAGWHFLTGEAEQIDRLSQAVGFRYEYDAETDSYIHASGIMILTPEGRLARYFYGFEYGPRDLRLGLVEAAANQIGSPVDQLLLLCYHYDPQTGQYGLVIMNTVRIAGFATVAVLGLFVVTMLRRERRRRPDGHTPG